MKQLKSAGKIFLTLLACAALGIGLCLLGVSRLKDNRKFGLVCMTMNNEFYDVIHGELYAGIHARSDRLITLDPQLNLNKQIEQIYWLIDQDVDGLFINPLDSKAIEEPVQKAWDKGIPVVILDAPLSDATKAIATIASNNAQAGQLCARHMMETLPEARIGLLMHSEVGSAKERIDSFLQEIENHPQYEVVASKECQGQLELAMPAVTQMLAEHPDIQVIMALNDPSAMGALAALQSLGRDDVLVYGVDGTPDIKKQLAKDSCITATAAQSPITMGQRAVQTMYDWLEDKECESDQILDVFLITRENVDQVSLAGWQ